jgi:hypothetical protein
MMGDDEVTLAVGIAEVPAFVDSKEGASSFTL